MLDRCTIVDARDPAARPGQRIHIEAGRIAWVGPCEQAPEFSGARSVDLAERYVVPGLGDAHVHLGFLDTRPPSADNIARHMAYCLEQAQRALRGGITMMRVVGEGRAVDVALRDLFASGAVAGPHLWVAGEALTPSAGHMADRSDFWGIRVCDGVEGWRKAARDQLQSGADHVKAIVTGGAIGHANDVTNAVTCTEDELRTAAEVVQARARPLIVHAAAPAGIVLAVRVGANSVEHAYDLDEPTANMLARTRTFLTPTLCVTHQIPSELRDDYQRQAFGENAMPDWVTKRREERYEAHLASYRLALREGVRILAGSDYAPHPAAAHLELDFLVRGGMSPHSALTAATLSFAEAVGATDRLGTIEPGKEADLVAVTENPLTDIRNLRRPELVLLHGRIVAERSLAAA